MEKRMVRVGDLSETPETSGMVFRQATLYDLALRLSWGGAERRYREKLLDLAGVNRGERIVDVGCGTGTLAIAAKRRVGEAGEVVGVDASREMIARARRKAAKESVDIDFGLAAAETLPFPDATFDAVLNTTMLHCLPPDARGRAIAEMRRVLRPGGRALIVDFGGPAAARRSPFGRMRPHRAFDLHTAIPMLSAFGFERVQTAPLDFSDLHFALAKA
jgi:ubiquinone/menaquinone biosynthesis C-methylase UbiE